MRSFSRGFLFLQDNLATCFLRAWDPDKPFILAPAMNTVMWEHPSTIQHLRTGRGCVERGGEFWDYSNLRECSGFLQIHKVLKDLKVLSIQVLHS